MTDPSLNHGIARPDGGPRDGSLSAQAAAQLLTFTCPRCGGEVTETFYGPCDACREALAQKFAGEAPSVEPSASGHPTPAGEDSDTWIDRL